MLNEKWIPLESIKGECSLSSISYDSNILSAELDSFLTGETISLSFNDVFSYRITLEHFRWEGIPPIDKTKYVFYNVLDSNYKEWLLREGLMQLYGESIPIRHIVLYCTEHIIDIILPKAASVFLNGHPLSID